MEEYLFPGGIDSLNVSSSGTLEGMILSIGWPDAGQSNQPENKDNVRCKGEKYQKSIFLG